MPVNGGEAAGQNRGVYGDVGEKGGKGARRCMEVTSSKVRQIIKWEKRRKLVSEGRKAAGQDRRLYGDLGERRGEWRRRECMEVMSGKVRQMIKWEKRI